MNNWNSRLQEKKREFSRRKPYHRMAGKANRKPSKKPRKKP